MAAERVFERRIPGLCVHLHLLSSAAWII